MVHWLGPGVFTAVAQVQSLVGELRSYKLHSATKKKKIHLQRVYVLAILSHPSYRFKIFLCLVFILSQVSFVIFRIGLISLLSILYINISYI